MPILKSYLKLNGSKLWIGFLFSVAIAVIVAAFPVERKFMFEFQKNKPWMHETLFAPFDFPIHKSEEELTHERDSISKGLKEYYKLDVGVAIEQIKAFEQNLNEQLSPGENGELSEPEKRALQLSGILVEKLEEIYNQGVLESVTDQEDQLTKVIVLIRDKFAEDVAYTRLLDLSSATQRMNELIGELEQSEDEEVAAVLKKLNVQDYIKVNVEFDQEKTELVKSSLLANISYTRGLVQKGEKIVASGDIVRDREFFILNSLKEEYETANVEGEDWYAIILGQTLLVMVSIFVLGLFIFYAQPQILENNRESLFIILIVLFFVLLANLVIRFPQLSIYLLPYAMLPIIVKTFFNARIALFVYVITILMIGFIAPNSFEFVFMQIIVGAIALYTLGDTYKRSYLFLASIIAFTAYSTIYFGIGVLQEADFTQVNWQQFIWFGGSSLLILTAQPLIYFFEKVFGFLSDATLIELSDTNHPLLRKLSDRAPGTFQHSLQVANLSEDAVMRIGGNALLARVGCLYHDIGKSLNPAYFTENQHKGRNPHDNKPPEESAKIIIDHIIEGEKLARKHNLPEPIIGIITGHHGSSKVSYFLRTARNDYPDRDIDESLFQYPYPSPRTKEQAVVMMADAIEAASRSLPDINEKSLRELIDKIVDYQTSEGQFHYADITFREIEQVKQSFVKRLLTMHHVRIAYPEDNSKK